MVFDAYPPYTILATDRIDFSDMQRLVRFARYWDLVANSGRFARTLPLILGDTPFANFMMLSDWLYSKTDATHRIALDRLAGLVSEWLCSRGFDADMVRRTMGGDYAGKAPKETQVQAATRNVAPQRQARHLAA
jgi:hypothetical protein